MNWWTLEIVLMNWWTLCCATWWIDELMNFTYCAIWWIDELMNFCGEKLMNWWKLKVCYLMNWWIDELCLLCYLMNWWIDELCLLCYFWVDELLKKDDHVFLVRTPGVSGGARRIITGKRKGNTEEEEKRRERERERKEAGSKENKQTFNSVLSV